MGRAGRCGAVCATTFSVDKSGAGNERINLWVYSSPLVAWAATALNKAYSTLKKAFGNPTISSESVPLVADTSLRETRNPHLSHLLRPQL
jgi:hypothetical protein